MNMLRRFIFYLEIKYTLLMSLLYIKSKSGMNRQFRTINLSRCASNSKLFDRIGQIIFENIHACHLFDRNHIYASQM